MYRREDIREYIRANWDYFGPDGLGWKRPSAAVEAYAKNPESWADDLIAVDALRQKAQRSQEPAEVENRPNRNTVDPETRTLMETIRQLADEGHAPDTIAAMVGVMPRGVRNVLALRDGRPLEPDPGILMLAAKWRMDRENEGGSDDD